MSDNNTDTDKRSYIKILKLLSIFLVIVVMGVVSYFTLRRGTFTIEEIIIQGNLKVKEREILKRSGLMEGGSSIFFLENQVAERILKNPWIKSASVKKEYPKKVIIKIEEEAIYCLMLDEDGKPYYLSKNGSRIQAGKFLEGLDFPVLIGDGINDSKLISEALLILQLSSNSDILNWNEISEIHLDTVYGINLYTTDGRQIEFDRKNIKSKWRKLEKIITHARASGFEESYINISSKQMGVVNFEVPVVKSGAQDG